MGYRYLWEAIQAGKYEVEKIGSWGEFEPKEVFETLKKVGISCSQDGGCWDIVKIGDNQYSGEVMCHMFVVEKFENQPLEYAALTAQRWFGKYE